MNVTFELNDVTRQRLPEFINDCRELAASADEEYRSADAIAWQVIAEMLEAIDKAAPAT